MRHLIVGGVRLNAGEAGHGYWVRCRCGWTSEFCGTAALAEAAGEQHLQLLRRMARPAASARDPGGDRTLGARRDPPPRGAPGRDPVSDRTVALELVPVDGPAVLAVRGELDAQTTSAFRSCVGTLLEAGERRVVLDLAGLTFIDSSGLGALVWVLKRLRREHGDLVLRNLTPQIAHVFSLSGLDRVLTVEA